MRKKEREREGGIEGKRVMKRETKGVTGIKKRRQRKRNNLHRLKKFPSKALPVRLNIFVFLSELLT